MELNFGMMTDSAGERKVAPSAPFRLAILGDFSGGANKGRLEVGDDLARRKPLRVDVDNIDKVMQRLNITLSLPMGGEGAVEFPIASIDDFHPDQLYEKVELFSAMSDLRQRVTSKSGFASAQKEMVAWRAEPGVPHRGSLRRPRGATVPRGGKLSDFAKLIGQPSAPPEAAEIAIDELLKTIVRPYIVKAKDPAQAALLGSLDKALASTMRKILHHPDFQILEKSLWRSIDMLTRRLETNTQLQIVLYDVSAEELAADLSSQDQLEETGLYKLLVEQPSVDANQGALAALIGNYMFDHTPPQAELLGRVAKIAAQANAPFISAISPDFLATKAEDVHPLIREAWDGLSALDEAKYIALVTPRFLMRQPYGDRTDPIDSFEFEEFTPQAGLKGMLWGNPAIIAGLLLGFTFSKQNAKMNLGSIMSVNEIPYYFYVDEDGDQTALPSTERLMSERVASLVRAQHFLPLLSIKGRPEVRLGGFNSLAGPAIAGRWPEPVGNVIPPKPVVEEEAAEGEEGADGSDDSGDSSGDLDDLMSSLDDTPSEESTDETPSDDAPAEDSGEMDPDLAELLKGL